jgi:hypothetical protein
MPGPELMNRRCGFRAPDAVRIIPTAAPGNAAAISGNGRPIFRPGGRTILN